LLRMLTGHRQAGSAADALQAERWRDWLLQERSDLARELANRRVHLEQCAASASIGKLSHLRSVIREVENEIRGVDRMVDSLARRFPDAIATLQRA
jgi:hypothetical protein